MKKNNTTSNSARRKELAEIEKALTEFRRILEEENKVLITISYTDKSGALQQGTHMKNLNPVEFFGMLEMLNRSGEVLHPTLRQEMQMPPQMPSVEQVVKQIRSKERNTNEEGNRNQTPRED